MSQAIPYIRFSSSVQQKGSSVDRQQKLIDEYLKSHPELTLSNLQYQDLGLSGYKGKHLENGLGELLEAVESGHIKSGDSVLVEAMDRLGRLPELEMISLLHSILKKGIKVITLQDNQEYSTASLSENSGLLYLLAGKVQMAHQHSKQLSERISAAWVKKRNQAELGKGVKRKAPWWISWNDETECFDVVTDEAKQIMTEVFSLYLQGRGERRILNHIKEAHPDKFQFTDPATVKKWLRNKTAIGYWNDIPDVYPAAITEQLYYQVQEELKVRATGKGKTPRSGHYLAGLVVCGCCGGNYSMRANKKSPDAMLCGVSNKSKEKCANGSTIPVQVFDWVCTETYEEALKKIEHKALSQEAEDELIVVKGRIVELEQQLDNLVELVAKGSKRVQTKVLELELELDELESRKSDLMLESRKPSELSFRDAALLGSELKDTPEVLQDLLRKAGYSITANRTTIKQGNRTWVYGRYYQKEDSYKMKEIDSEGGLIEEFLLSVFREPTEEQLKELSRPPKTIIKM
ncbi:recombinase family protein [Vibrio cyclitrophicus]